MKMRCAMRDSRGNKSTTLTLVVVSWAVITAKFLFAGISLPLLGDVPPMSGGEYAAAAGAVLGIWLGREWTEKHSRRSEHTGRWSEDTGEWPQYIAEAGGEEHW